MMYAFLDWNLFKVWRPLHLFPLPYKWLIGPAFYFYVKNQFVVKHERPFHKREWYLFIPAIVYGCLRLYWFGIAASEEDGYRITAVLVDSNFFRIQEVIVLAFDIILGILALRFIQHQKSHLGNPAKYTKTLHWLKTFVWVFISIHTFALLTYIVDLSIHNGIESFEFLYPQLIVNVAYIYWIGYIGFTHPKVLFTQFKVHANTPAVNPQLHRKLTTAISEEVYTNANLTLTDLATQLDVSPKELSGYINEVHHMNFSEFLNFHRVEKVKQLLRSDEAKKYTLVTLAQEAGFSSKSSFNATFKKMTGMTPSGFRKSL